jgi:hypothetical protein
MLINRKIILTGDLFAVVIISVAAIEPSPEKNEFKNLKALPKDISSKDLQKVMVDEFQDGLGVGCNYCYARKKESLHLDYKSDERPEKEIARSMKLMTMDINKKHFGVEDPIIGENVLTTSCCSCHHGTAHPDKTD